MSRCRGRESPKKQLGQFTHSMRPFRCQQFQNGRSLGSRSVSGYPVIRQLGLVNAGDKPIAQNAVSEGECQLSRTRLTSDE
jgi:hypothetical protein